MYPLNDTLLSTHRLTMVYMHSFQSIQQPILNKHIVKSDSLQTYCISFFCYYFGQLFTIWAAELTGPVLLCSCLTFSNNQFCFVQQTRMPFCECHQLKYESNSLQANDLLNKIVFAANDSFSHAHSFELISLGFHSTGLVQSAAWHAENNA